MKKLGVIILVVVLISGLYIFLQPAEEQDEISQDPVREKKQPQTELEDAQITLHSTDEQTKWQLTAQSIARFENPQEVQLEQIQAQVYQNDQEIITLIAEQGSFDPQTGFLSLSGSLTIKGQDKLIKADKLKWNQAKNELTGQGDIVIKQNELTITGDRFISQIDLKKLQVLGNTRTNLTPIDN
ncbi:LPS export ABC transporter periplasmic protein LptC [Halanaerobaculum tunisiense]